MNRASLVARIADDVLTVLSPQVRLGVDLNMDEAGKYPYQRAYLPYNRLADGTVHDW